MSNKLLTAVIATAFVSISGASWAQVGGNAIPKYLTVAGTSTNKKVTSNGVGGNSMPSYPKAEHLTKNSKVVSHGVGGNAMPIYPKVGTH